MARERKPVELRTVDDEPKHRLPVLRLGVDEQPVRLIPENKDTHHAPAARLMVPHTELLDNRRSHQPGVDVLIEPEEASVEDAEEGWSRSEVRREPIPWGWFVLIGLLLAWALIWSLSYVRQAEPMVEAEHQQAGAMVGESAASDRALADMIEGMERHVKAFCEADTLEAMLPLVRHARETRPLMERYYAQTPLHALGFKGVRNFQGAVVGGTERDFWVFTVALGDGSIREIQVEQEPSGRLGVDWETVVTYQPMNWNDYARQRPRGTTLNFRVFVEEDHFFTHEYADAERWASFRLTAQGGEETLFGYVPRGGELETELLRLIERNEKNPVAVILRLSLPAATQSRRGVIIEKVMSSQWIYVYPPDTES
ncbi:MAG: hypothetical protein WCP35_14625 [Verrucomicrobiota bacterium]